MISNYVLLTKITNLKKKRSELVDEKNRLVKLLQEFGLSENQKYKMNQGKAIYVSPEVKAERHKLVNRMLQIEKELTPIKIELLQLHREEDAEENKELMNVFKEIFTVEQIIEIKKEAQRRMAGEHPFRLSFSVKDAIDNKTQSDKYKKLAKEQLEKMIEFRILLNQVIQKGIDSFGEAEFLKVISPLNRLIIPVEELKKIKLRHLI